MFVWDEPLFLVEDRVLEVLGVDRDVVGSIKVQSVVRYFRNYADFYGEHTAYTVEKVSTDYTV